LLFQPDAVSKKVLIVDDDPAVLQSYGRLLARLGHAILLVEDCARLRQEPDLLRGADLLILDHRMPCENGLEFLAALRERARGAAGSRADAPAVLLISAFLTDDLQAEARRLGVLEVLEKPVDPLRLVARVRAALQETGEGMPPAADRAGGGSRGRP
jgi:DNA-binding response OmpR family regulator